MRKALFFLLAIIVSANAFAQDDNIGYVKAPDGSEYKVYKSVNGEKIKTGNFLEMNVIASYRDSILYNSIKEGMPQYGLYDTANFPTPFKQAFASVHVGDSVIIRIPTDSLIAKGQAAPFMQNGQFIYQAYTVTNIYLTKEKADSVQKIYASIAEAKEKIKSAVLIAEESKRIEAYLATNNLKAIKTDKGTYVVITKEGTGKNIAGNVTALVNYTGKTFNTKTIFDSNTDPSFEHVKPYPVVMGPRPPAVIAGWPDAIAQMKKGTKAIVIIPSPLGYGSHGNPPRIEPDEILMFDMEIVNVLTTANNTGNTKTTAKPKTTVKPKTIAKPKPAIKKTGK